VATVSSSVLTQTENAHILHKSQILPPSTSSTDTTDKERGKCAWEKSTHRKEEPAFLLLILSSILLLS